MKKFIFLLPSLIVMALFYACGEKDDIDTDNELEKKFFTIEKGIYHPGPMPSSTTVQTVGSMINISDRMTAGAIILINITSDKKISKFFIGVKEVPGYIEYVPNKAAAAQPSVNRSYTIPMMVSDLYAGKSTLVIGGQYDDNTIANPVMIELSDNYPGNKEDEDPNAAKVTHIKLSQTASTIFLRESIALTTTTYPTNVKGTSIKWSSSDPAKATVKDGVITTHTAGHVIISATVGNATSECDIRVTNEMARTSIKLNQRSLTTFTGETVYLTASGNRTEKVTWTSSNPDIAVVTDGRVNALRRGETTITATATDGVQATCHITVEVFVTPLY